MKKASPYAFISQKSKPQASESMSNRLHGGLLAEPEADLNMVVLTFDTMKESEKNLAGGDPYSCKKCEAILNKYSVVKPAAEVKELKVDLKANQSLWTC